MCRRTKSPGKGRRGGGGEERRGGGRESRLGEELLGRPVAVDGGDTELVALVLLASVSLTNEAQQERDARS